MFAFEMTTVSLSSLGSSATEQCACKSDTGTPWAIHMSTFWVNS